MPRRHAASRHARSEVRSVGVVTYLAALVLLAATVAPGPTRAQEESAPAPGAAPAPNAAPAVPAPAYSPEREQFLLREACRYLRLTPGLAAHLLPIARQTDRRRALFQTEEQQGQRALDGLPPGQDAEAERIRKILEEDRAKANGEITTYAAPQVVRLFTREQIALAHRLLQGAPPLYAHADPALTESDSGFVRQGSFGGPGAIIYLHNGVDDFRGGRALPRGGAFAPEPEAARLEALTLDYARQRAALDLDNLTLRSGRVTRLSEGMAGKPFPQWVVETDDLAGLTAAIEPLVERLFTSPELVPVLQDGLRHGFGAVTRVSVPSGAGRVVRDYRMERGLRDLTGHGRELEPLGGQVQNGLYQFGPGQGLHAADLGVTDHYSVELIVRYFGGDSYQKIIDFKNGTKDIGLYYYQGHLDFYQMASGGAPQPGVDHRLRLERNRATRIVRGFQDGRLVFSFIDLDDDAVFDKGTATFFVDDKATSGENGPGALTSLLVWGGPVDR